jgi:hypothetical protein
MNPGCKKVRFVTIRKLEGIERIGLIVISNRGVTIRSAVASDKWVVMSET